jgi:chorismate synthase
VARVLAGAVAKMYLLSQGISIQAYVSQVYNIKLDKAYSDLDLNQIESNMVRCPDPEKAKAMIALIEQTKAEGDSLGGVISCVCKGVPVGLGEPVFDKLHAQLGKAILSINACKGFEIGNGFESVNLKGSENNDAFETDNNKQMNTQTNHSGGVLGGITNGMDIFFRAAFKPVSSIKKSQETINTSFENTSIHIEGRHDPCVVPRAVPIVEAMTALVLIDLLLRNKMYQ